MSFDREDFYEECKSYCDNIEFIPILNQLIFDADYGNGLNKEELLKLKQHLINQIKAIENKRFGRILDNCGMIE
ncbi:MAG: hypothetical protein IKF11_06640 [Methanobrevibacter sp.]|nr:hypothetical protein [Methanobrevibacter sp.]